LQKVQIPSKNHLQRHCDKKVMQEQQKLLYLRKYDTFN
jgi:hypothetical protein